VTKFKTVDEYIASHPEPVQKVLERVRHSIRKALPGAEESISYNIPTYKRDGFAAIYFAGWKKHYSLYPASSQLLTAFAAELASYEINKATIKFPLSEPVPVKLIARLAAFRAREVSARASSPRS
jgi:uncharacterized protein YdhG (YjbR/CyaY superfamily)